MLSGINYVADYCCGDRPTYISRYWPWGFKLKCQKCSRAIEHKKEKDCVELWNRGVRVVINKEEDQPKNYQQHLETLLYTAEQTLLCGQSTPGKTLRELEELNFIINRIVVLLD